MKKMDLDSITRYDASTVAFLLTVHIRICVC